MEDTLSDLLTASLENLIEEWKKQNIDDKVIQKRIDGIDYVKVTDALLKKRSDDLYTYVDSNMYKIVAEQKTYADEFVVHQEQKWGDCFCASYAFYIVVIESVTSFSKLITQYRDEDQIREKRYTLLALQHMHARACQEFLEILHLIRYGFADGAYARWRSMYELCCNVNFIKKYGENIAKQYCEQSETENQKYDWTKGAIVEDGKEIKINSFADIQKYCEINEAWKKQYKVACMVNHGSPQGTFKRLANTEKSHTLLVGHSDYGIETPAVQSAISLLWITTLFYNSIRNADYMAHIYVFQKWVDKIKMLYTDAAERLNKQFPESEQ